MQTTATDWLQIIRGEYLELPDLRLTRSQVKRMWKLDDRTCDALLDALVQARFLRLTRDQRYIRMDVGVDSV